MSLHESYVRNRDGSCVCSYPVAIVGNNDSNIGLVELSRRLSLSLYLSIYVRFYMCVFVCAMCPCIRHSLDSIEDAPLVVKSMANVLGWILLK